MGGAVSSGENNDELVDNLLEAEYIKTPEIEKIFRTVDRAFYYTKSHRQSPYKDLAWKHGNLHLSAPCIYSEVLENLKLEPGYSFLNIGSGTGYLSTMAGLILGKWGINHGIELHIDVVEYATFKLEKFKKSSYAVDLFDFCEPVFVVGNALDALPSPSRYDRIYCGAGCPRRHLQAIIDSLKVGGIAVVPVNDSLLQIKRVSEAKVEEQSLLSVSFASLVESKSQTPLSVSLPEWNVLTLAEMCRAVIRECIRTNCRGAVSDQDIGKPVPVIKSKKRNSRIAGTCMFTPLNGADIPGAGIVSITYAVRSPAEERMDSQSSIETENSLDQTENVAESRESSNVSRVDRRNFSGDDSSETERGAPASSDDDTGESRQIPQSSSSSSLRKRAATHLTQQVVPNNSSSAEDAKTASSAQTFQNATRETEHDSSSFDEDEGATPHKFVHRRQKEDLDQKMDEDEFLDTQSCRQEENAEKERRGPMVSLADSNSTFGEQPPQSSQRSDTQRSSHHRYKRPASGLNEPAELDYSSDEDDGSPGNRRYMNIDRRGRRCLHPVARMFRLNVPVGADNSDSGDSIESVDTHVHVMHVGPMSAPSPPSPSTDLSEEYVDEPLPEITHPLTVTMRSKISQLPLPMILKSFVNYDRNL